MLEKNYHMIFILFILHLNSFYKSKNDHFYFSINV